MTLYADFTYFGLLLYLVVPTIILGLFGRANAEWAGTATLGALVVQYRNQLFVRRQMPIREIWVVLGYAGFQFAVVALFLKLCPQLPRRRHGTSRRQLPASGNVCFLSMRPWC